MTQEQAIEVLISRYNSGVIRSRTNDDEWRLATETVIAALRGPQPDPETGLVRCGCGGKAETHELYGDFSGTYMTDCKKCATGTTQYNTKKEAQDAWNTAMGWKGGAE